RDFDRVASALELDNERRVIEVASLAMLTRGFDGLEDAAVEADGVTTRAKRNPIQIQGCCGRWLHCYLEVSSAACPPASGVARAGPADCPQAGKQSAYIGSAWYAKSRDAHGHL